ncbi:MAG TPA: nitroreductase family protein [Dehalococcoidia bacterium]|nr:nitroreductase family protein [Dehalococcoidia bacterium]
MEVFEAVRTLLAVRAYQDRPIPAEIVQRIAESAHLTASSRNGQPWQFIVVQDRATLKRLGELATSGPYTAQAPLAIAVAMEDSPFNVSDASRAIQSMMLTAWSEGIGSNWVGWLGTLDEINEVLDLPPELKLIAVVPFGYPVTNIGRGKKNRRPFNEVVHRERYGQSF